MTSILCPDCGYVAASRAALGGHVTRQHHADRTVLLLAAYTDTRGPDECWPWLGTLSARQGYAVLVVDRRQRRVARIVLGLRDGDPDQACHSCDNPPCVNARHLFRASAAANQHDKAAKGRAARGEANGGGGKLTRSDVRAIRASDAPTRELAATYNVSGTMIRRVRSRQAWRHVQ